MSIQKLSSSFSSEDCTGVLNVRYKKSTHLKLVKLAEKENVSVSPLYYNFYEKS